jgi:DNA-binding transcriptional regulator WhiA
MQEYEMIRKTVMMDVDLANDINLFARKDARDFSGALRYAARIGLLAIENPDLTVQEIKDILEARAEFEKGKTTELDIRAI